MRAPRAGPLVTLTASDLCGADQSHGRLKAVEQSIGACGPWNQTARIPGLAVSLRQVSYTRVTQLHPAVREREHRTCITGLWKGFEEFPCVVASLVVQWVMIPASHIRALVLTPAATHPTQLPGKAAEDGSTCEVLQTMLRGRHVPQC